MQLKVCTDIPLDPPDKEPKRPLPKKRPPGLHGGSLHREGIIVVNGLNAKYNGCECENAPPAQVDTRFKTHRLDLKCPSIDGDVLVEIETLRSYLDDHSLSQFLAADVEVIVGNWLRCGVSRTDSGRQWLKQIHVPECPQILRNRMYARLQNFRKNAEVWQSDG